MLQFAASGGLDMSSPAANGYRRLWRDWLRPYRGLLLLGTAFLVVVAISAAGYSKAVQQVIAAFETGDKSVIYWGPATIVALSMVKGITNYIRMVSINLGFSRSEVDLQKAMYTKMLHSDIANLQTDSPASLAVRFSSDIALIRRAIEASVNALSALLIILATVGVMLSIDAQVTVILLSVFALAIVPVNVIGGRVRRISRATQRELSDMNSAIVEGLAGIRMARTYQLESHLQKTTAAMFERLRDLKIRLVKWQSRLSPLMEILSGLAIAVLLVVVSWRIAEGRMTIADFMGLLTGISVISQPARQLGSTWSQTMQGRAALERVFATLDTDNHIIDGPDARSLENVNGHIRFDHVTFHYPDGFKALDDVSLDIPAGERVAFVGRSGAGKSSIFNLVPRLFDASNGQVILDGMDVRQARLADLRKNIAVVGQESTLLAGSIADNIGFGRAGASRADIVAAAEAASARGFIEALECGFDTVISPAGNRFSGGEKQRLSIARAILRDAPILLLDEPTSALDAQSEAEIRVALDRLSHNRTTLIIAHRLATILDADRIVVMDQGQVVEQGTHTQLLQQNGLYAELYRLQFSESR